MIVETIDICLGQLSIIPVERLYSDGYAIGFRSVGYEKCVAVSCNHAEAYSQYSSVKELGQAAE